MVIRDVTVPAAGCWPTRRRSRQVRSTWSRDAKPSRLTNVDELRTHCSFCWIPTVNPPSKSSPSTKNTLPCGRDWYGHVSKYAALGLGVAADLDAAIVELLHLL